MKILLAPSEGKTPLDNHPKLNTKSFHNLTLYNNALEIAKRYNEFVNTSDTTALSKLFGIKKEGEIEATISDIFTSPTTKVVELYSGVAYEYLDYHSLSTKAQNYLHENLYIFSNLFGPLRADDTIPPYKLKQGEKIDGFHIENYYKITTSKILDTLFEGEFIVDLRAGYYEKFYTIPFEHITYKFIKNGKVLSHWSKAYRGIILRHIAQNLILSKEELLSLEIPNLQIVDIQKKRNQELITCEIIG